MLQDGDKLYTFFELENAKSLDNFEKLNILSLLEVMKKLADILDSFHKQRLVYMDLKPENILYDDIKDDIKKQIKFFDFDACVDLNKLDQVERFYATNDKNILPPEIKFTRNLNENKDILISPAIDVYEFGANFYYLLTDRAISDEEIEDGDLLEKNLRKTLDQVIYKAYLDKTSQDRIIEIIKKSTRPVFRNISMGEISSLLGLILKKLNGKSSLDIEKILTAAYILSENPLYDYIKEEEGEKFLDIGLVGDYESVFYYLKLIFSAVSLEGVGLRFSIYGPNSKESYLSLIEKAPLLKESCQIFLEGKKVSGPINHEISDLPYASLNFYQVEDQDELVEKIDASYIILTDDFYEDLAGKIYRKFIKSSQEKRIIINCKYITYRLRNHENENLKLVNYSQLDFASFESRRIFNKKIFDMAFEVHRFYTLLYKERADYEEIWQDFIGDDYYNLISSLRTALSIQYKLFDAGFTGKDPKKMADFFYQEVLKERGEQLKSVFDPERRTDYKPNLRDRMAYLEHHSRNKFMIMDGRTRPSLDEINNYAFRGKNDHRDKENHKHPLITNSSLEYKGELDGLDKASILINDILKSSVEEEKSFLDQEFFYILCFLKDLKEESDKILKNHIEDLQNIAEKIRKGDKNSDKNRDVVYEEAKKIIDKAPKYSLIKERLESIKNMVARLKKINNPVDYKLIDYQIIDAIPLILYGPVDIIYKPFVSKKDQLWKNIAACLKFYPRKIVFIENEEDDREKYDHIVRFLKEKRLQKSIETELVTYEDLEIEDSYQDTNLLLDLTGNNHSQARRDKYKELPYVEYLGLNKWGGDYKALKYYENNISLTIDETFFLNNARLTSSRKKDLVLDLREKSDKLWQVYKTRSSFVYMLCLSVLAKLQEDYIFDLSSYKEDETTYKGMLENPLGSFRSDNRDDYRSLLGLLDKLVENKILVGYQYPKNLGSIKITCKDKFLLARLIMFLFESLRNGAKNFDLISLSYPLFKDEDKSKAEAPYLYVVSDRLRFFHQIDSYSFMEKDTKFSLETNIKRFNNFLEEYDKNLKPGEVRVFNKIDKEKDYAYLDSSGNKVNLQIEYGKLAFREFFEKEGNALETYAYFELLKNKEIFDNLALNVELAWKKSDDFASISDYVENEIDLVFTKNASTFLISCKQSQIKNDFVYEIKNHAGLFGIDTVPIIINYNDYKDGLEGFLRVKNRCKASGVYLIDKDMVDKGLAKYLKNIVEGKKDWEEIEDD
jgi:serine/threonine protein kinase